MPRPRTTTTKTTNTRVSIPRFSLQDHLHEGAHGAGLPFDQALRLHARHVLLRRLHDHPLASAMTLAGGDALAVHLGAAHRRVSLLELLLDGTTGLDAFRHIALPEIADHDRDGQGLRFDRSTITGRPIDRGAAQAQQLVLFASLGTAEAAVRLNVECCTTKGQRGGHVTARVVPAPFDFGLPVKMNVATPSGLFADAVETMVRRDALRVPMRSILDAWMAAQIDPLDEVDGAIAASFARRGTPIPAALPLTLSAEFAAGAHAESMWAQFCEREAPRTPVTVEDAVACIRAVAAAAFEALHVS